MIMQMYNYKQTVEMDIRRSCIWSAYFLDTALVYKVINSTVVLLTYTNKNNYISMLSIIHLTISYAVQFGAVSNNFNGNDKNRYIGKLYHNWNTWKMQNISFLMSPRSPSGFTDIKKPNALHHQVKAKNLHFNP